MSAGHDVGYARDLVFDLGLHSGQDTDFYLKKGFRVVAVDANDALCRAAEERFADAVSTGQLTVVNRAIAPEPGEITFYENERTSWGTIDPEWAARNERMGARSITRTVIATTMPALLADFGTPYYLKVDIEGMDLVALEGLAAGETRPKYVSIESEKVSFKVLRREIETFAGLGYDRFKLVDQTKVVRQRLPDPPREGQFVRHDFPSGATGAFGEEAPGRWISAEEAIEAYKPIFLRYALVGDDPVLPSRVMRRALTMLGYRAAWYDTHARLAGT